MWGKSICYLSKENIPHLEISETDTSLCGLMWRHMTCCRLLFWPPSWLDNLGRKQNASIFHELQSRLALLLTENLEALQTSGWPILPKKECFFFPWKMETRFRMRLGVCFSPFQQGWMLSLFLDLDFFMSCWLMWVLKKTKQNKSFFCCLFVFLDKIYKCVGNYEIQ